MIDIEDQIRTVLCSEADAMRVPEVMPGKHVTRVVQLRAHLAGARPLRSPLPLRLWWLRQVW